MRKCVLKLRIWSFEQSKPSHIEGKLAKYYTTPQYICKLLTYPLISPLEHRSVSVLGGSDLMMKVRASRGTSLERKNVQPWNSAFSPVNFCSSLLAADLASASSACEPGTNQNWQPSDLVILPNILLLSVSVVCETLTLISTGISSSSSSASSPASGGKPQLNCTYR